MASVAERKTRVGIVGAGNVGRSVAQELLDNGHKVLLIERERRKFEPHVVPDADWLFADACEVATLEEAGAETCDVLIAATGDDKANLVVGLLAKSEFGVPRVVARINEIRNEWLFTQAWGIDVAVSTPGAMVAGVEGAIDVGHLVRLMGLRQGQADLAKRSFGSPLPPPSWQFWSCCRTSSPACPFSSQASPPCSCWCISPRCCGW